MSSSVYPTVSYIALTTKNSRPLYYPEDESIIPCYHPNLLILLSINLIRYNAQNLESCLIPLHDNGC